MLRPCPSPPNSTSKAATIPCKRSCSTLAAQLALCPSCVTTLPTSTGAAVSTRESPGICVLARFRLQSAEMGAGRRPRRRTDCPISASNRTFAPSSFSKRRTKRHACLGPHQWLVDTHRAVSPGCMTWSAMQNPLRRQTRWNRSCLRTASVHKASEAPRRANRPKM